MKRALTVISSRWARRKGVTEGGPETERKRHEHGPPLPKAAIAKAAFEAYANDDRAAIEQLIAEDFSFMSPLDNGIGRETYFARCWPNHETIAAFHFIRAVEAGDEVIVTYEGETHEGRGFRNTEVLTVRDDAIHAVEVYFGWSLPHEAAPGGFTGS